MPFAFRHHRSFRAAQFAFSLLLGCCLLGCGPGQDDPAVVQRLKDAGMLPMKQNDKVYQIKGLMQPLTEQAAQDIAATPGLKNLDLSSSELTDDLFAKAVEGQDLVMVVLSETAITDAGLKAVSGFSRVEAIFLRNTAVGDEGLKALGGLNSLAELDLTGTKVTSAGLAALKDLGGLKRLILDKTAVDDAGLAHLAGISSLVRLEVRETAVTAEGAGELGKQVSGLLIER